mmetsp:Transcript_9659/g.16987  ORF Transcript_9659/g.16987 Transcript_9659/m.16987 type:complete len:195 (+) Transcript_9659:31-615(+)
MLTVRAAVARRCVLAGCRALTTDSAAPPKPPPIPPPTPPSAGGDGQRRMLGRLGKVYASVLSPLLGPDDDMRYLAAQCASGATYAVVLVSGLGTIGVDTTPFLTAFGAASVALGLAAKDSVTNVLGGAALVVQKPFKKGDEIIVHGAGGAHGYVIAVDARYTHIRDKTDSNRVMMIPSNTVYNSMLTVVSSKKK